MWYQWFFVLLIAEQNTEYQKQAHCSCQQSETCPTWNVDFTGIKIMFVITGKLSHSKLKYSSFKPIFKWTIPHRITKYKAKNYDDAIFSRE